MRLHFWWCRTGFLRDRRPDLRSQDCCHRRCRSGRARSLATGRRSCLVSGCKLCRIRTTPCIPVHRLQSAWCRKEGRPGQSPRGSKESRRRWSDRFVPGRCRADRSASWRLRARCDTRCQNPSRRPPTSCRKDCPQDRWSRRPADWLHRFAPVKLCTTL